MPVYPLRCRQIVIQEFTHKTVLFPFPAEKNHIISISNSTISAYLQGVFKKRPNFCYKDFILQHFKHCPLQSSPLYWRYTDPSVSSIFGMLPGTHFLWWCAVLLTHFPTSPRVQKKTELFKQRSNQQRGRATAIERTYRQVLTTSCSTD
jgi:hypothetical protein